MTDAWVDDAAVQLVALADEIARRLHRHPSRLDRAVVLDALVELAGELRDADVRSTRPRTTWASIGRAFGISQQGASKRWG